MAPALQQVQQSSVSLSELAQIQNKLDSTLTAATAASKDIQQLKAKELPALNTAISDLSRRVGPTSVTAVVSDADKALAVDLAGVRSDLSGLAVRLAAQEAGELAKQGVATKEDMQVIYCAVTNPAGAVCGPHSEEGGSRPPFTLSRCQDHCIKHSAL